MKRSCNGFTIVELAIVIVVIAILASVTVVGYRGYQERAAQVAMQNDLINARDTMEIAAINLRGYPTLLPTTTETSDGVTLNLVTSPHYSGLSDVQEGVLWVEICKDLINEDRGKGTNLGGGTDAYITACNVWNYDEMQINGWDPQVYHTPISEADVINFINGVPAGDAWHPNQQSVIKGFHQTLHDRFISMGGEFPIDSFWDSWATTTNGGVMSEPLPAPDPTSGYSTSFCIEATSEHHDVTPWRIVADGNPVQGGC